MAISTQAPAISVVFVCLGNICRSPMAEGVFQHLVSQQSAHHLVSHIDSAGTGAYHVGDGPDPRTMSVLEDHGIISYRHRARKFNSGDFKRFQYILAMDDENFEYLMGMRKQLMRKEGLHDEQLGKVMLFGDFGGRKGEEVVDPYYGARDGFTIAYEQMVRFSKGLLDHLESQAKPNREKAG